MHQIKAVSFIDLDDQIEVRLDQPTLRRKNVSARAAASKRTLAAYATAQVRTSITFRVPVGGRPAKVVLTLGLSDPLAK
jgi:hypothetical protein